MTGHPYRDVCIVGVCNTPQARQLDDHDTATITFDAALGAIADAGLTVGDIDGAVGGIAGELVYQARVGPAWTGRGVGIGGVLEAASAIATGRATTVVVADGSAGRYRHRESTAPWTRPSNEFVMPYGMFTAAEFALIARRHMHTYGTTEEALATVAATIRNNGHVNPDAVYYGRGPFTPDDILASRMVADPYHLLDCAMTSEGGCGIVLTRAERIGDVAHPPVWILGGASDSYGNAYTHPPVFDLGGRRRPDLRDGWVGRGAAERCWAMCGLGPDDVDVCEFYDPFSFEIIRQFEALGFCGEGEGGPFVLEGTIGSGGRFPVTTDGGTMAFSHSGTAQLLQRIARAVMQLRGKCPTRQVEGAEVAICTNNGAGALLLDVLLLGGDRP